MAWITGSEANGNRIVLTDQNFTKVLGRRQFQFGGRYRREGLHVQGRQPRLTNSFQSSLGISQYAGHDSANFFLGLANSYDTVPVRPWYHMTGRTAAGHIQDNFKATPRLTLNFGVRWEYFPPFPEDNGLLPGFDIPSKTGSRGRRSITCTP